VLFTDIVGSTELAAELGDRAWRELLERHHAAVRHELKAFNGREMGTSGDGFLALFDSPERAVRCAESIIARVGLLGLRVRAGVHTGECEIFGGEVAGMAVHIGSRVAALAGSGEVLVSGSVRDLMTGSDRHFEGGEARQLKGVAEPWRVYRLVPEQVDGKLPAQRRSLVPVYTRRSQRRLLVVLAGLLVAAVGLSTLGYRLTTTADAEVVVGENEVGIIGPGADSEVVDAVAVGKRPTALAAGFGSVWVTNSTDDSVTRIDRRTLSPAPISVGSSPSGIAVGAGSVWVANSGDATVSRIDPGTARSTIIPVRPGPAGIVVAFGSVWVTNARDASVTEIDPDTNEPVEVVPVGASPTGIAAGAGYLWVTNQGDGTVTRFHPRTHEADSPVKVGEGPVGIAVSGNAAWVANNLEGSLYRIDVEDLTVNAHTLDKDGGAYGVAARGDDVWVSNEYAGTLMRVTARTFRLADKVPLTGAPLGLAYAGKELWFTSAAGGSALHRGGVLTMVATWGLEAGDDAPDTDLTLHYTGSSWQLAQLTNDGLVGFRRAGGVQGAVVVPDLATSLPKPTDGGRTYTFHLRKGVRYSTGAPVLAGDIRRGIERSVLYSAPAKYLRSAIVGAKACGKAADKAVAADKPRPPCDLSKGIVADDRTGTITFHLTGPNPEFLYQLALPNASAVPQDTPDDLPPGTYLPATGPYMIRSLTAEQDAGGRLPAGHGRLELVRNPHFRVWSPAAQPAGYPDRIVLETGYTARQAVAQVADGRADLVFDLVSSADVEGLGTRYSPQLHTAPGVYTQFLYLNTATPPFDNADARRAVAYALDRRALTATFGFSARVTCQLIPPGFAAYRDYCPFTLPGGAAEHGTAPDVNRADALVRKSGTRGAKVVLLSWLEPRSQLKELGDVLTGLGYRVSVRRLREFPPEYAVTHRHSWNLGIQNWGADYPAASAYLAVIGACDGPMNLSRYCDREVDHQIKAALVQQVTDPGSANDAWSRIDREVVRAAAVIPFAINLRQDFVSRRVGNTPVHPITGPLIAQMWVQ
jgi:ABC-type transport system substrate-binding protein/streptogramin lyase